MADLLDGMIYAAMMTTLSVIKDECKKYDECSDKCTFRDDNGTCLLNHCPDRYNLNRISKALLDNTPDE